MNFMVFKVGQFFVKLIGGFETEHEAVEFAKAHTNYVVYDTAEHAIVRKLSEINKEHALETLGSDYEVRMFLEHCSLEAECDLARIRKYLRKHNIAV